MIFFSVRVPFLFQVFKMAIYVFSFLYYFRENAQRGVEIVAPPSRSVVLLHGQNINEDNEVEDHVAPRSGLENDNNNGQPPQLGQLLDVNLSPCWTQFYSTGILYHIYICTYI